MSWLKPLRFQIIMSGVPILKPEILFAQFELKRVDRQDTQLHESRLQALEAAHRKTEQNQMFVFLGGACIGGAVAAILNTWGGGGGAR